MTTKLVIGLALAAVLGAAACKKTQSLAVVRGATQQEIDQSGNAETYVPKYAAMGDQAAGGEVRIGIFITHDKQSWDGRSGVFDDDYSFKTLTALEAWLKTGVNGEAPFLDGVDTTIDEAVRMHPNYNVTIRGKRPPLSDPSGAPVPWTIFLVVKSTDDLLTEVAESLANNHITLFNGHFADPAWPKPTRDAYISNRYGAMIRTYATFAAAGQSKAPYAVAVFNGCGSEDIEDKLLGAAADREIDIVANRCYSKYQSFPTQITTFLNKLTSGVNWRDAIGAFETDGDAAYPSMPVYRSMRFGQNDNASAPEYVRCPQRAF